MKFIGISGRQQAGKSTVAEYLKENIDNVLIWGFGTCVKWEFLEEYPALNIEYTVQDLDRQGVKEVVLDNGKTIRDELIRIGTERRDEDPDYWVKQWKQHIELAEDFDIVIAPDVRFENEVKAIQDLGGMVIRLTRNPIDSDDPCDTALDWMDSTEIDCVIANEMMDIDDTNKVCLDIVKDYLNE